MGDVYEAILSHPFIIGLTTGELDEEKFRFYIAQDSLYLREYGKVLAIAAAKAEEREHSRFFAESLARSIKVEQEMHEAFMRAWGMRAEEMSPTNTAYTNFLLATAYSRPFHEVVGAILPCFWIYMEVGSTLKAKGSRNALFQKWIDTYGGEEYERGVKRAIEIVNELELGERERRATKEKFRMAAIYEYMFWDSAYRLERYPFRLTSPL
ncbi:thiaminase II [Sulfodiicoccus acidiphilus]|uniref:Thiaminase II n=1 Tax=Sulfodiicoccus acidiphilus TaxID=1670455 RepID=A0A348B3Z0_9CREN|nr:thiaminase II [Sulfodiicoccus acidiphilus]GGT88200.1 thiaminase II [Sulfodiicoccus acidiphilus]